MRLNRFTFVTAWSSLCLHSARAVTSTAPRLDSRWVVALAGAGIAPAGNVRLALAHPNKGHHVDLFLSRFRVLDLALLALVISIMYSIGLV